MRVIVALVASAFILTPAYAAGDEAAPAEGKVKEKKICRTNQLDTGTRLGGRRVCKTAAEWADQERDAQNTLKNLPSTR